MRTRIIRDEGAPKPSRRRGGPPLAALTAPQTIRPAGIASAEAWGTPDVVGPILVGAGIPSAEAWGSPLLSAPSEILPLGIHSGEIWSNPTVAGPVTVPPGIPSAEAWGGPTVLQAQNIAPDGIGSQESWGTFKVAQNAQHVFPSGIPSGEAWGTPAVASGAQWIRAVGIPSAERWGSTAVAGGSQALSLRLGFVDRTKYLRVQTLQVTFQLLGRAVATFTLFDNTLSFAPSLGMVVQATEAGRKLFAGCLNRVVRSRYLSTEKATVYVCTAVDKASRLDWRVVDVTFDADSDGADDLLFLVTNFLDGEGFSVAGIPASLGQIGTQLILHLVSATQAFDALTTLVGCQWWVDVDGVIHVAPLEDAPECPITLTETSRNWRNLSVDESLTDYATRVYVKSNLNLLPGSSVLPVVGGPKRTETYTVPQPYAVQQMFTQGSAKLDFPIVSITAIRVDGVDVGTVYQGTDRVDLSNKWYYFPQTPYVTAPATGAPSNGQVVEIDYVPVAANAAVQTGTPLLGGVGTCGSGKYETVYQAANIQYQEDADALAAARLQLANTPPVVISFETDDPGCFPGQHLVAFIPNAGVTDLDDPTQPIDLYLTSVSGGSLYTPLKDGSSFRWQVQASNRRDFGNSTKWFERLLRASQFALPINILQPITFVLAPGYSVTGATVQGVVTEATVSGQIIRVTLVTDNPPTDQDLQLDITADGVSIFGPGGAVLPAGVTDLVIITEFAQTPMYLRQFQLMRCTVGYKITGPNPLPAQSVVVRVYLVQ